MEYKVNIYIHFLDANAAIYLLKTVLDCGKIQLHVLQYIIPFFNHRIAWIENSPSNDFSTPVSSCFFFVLKDLFQTNFIYTNHKHNTLRFSLNHWPVSSTGKKSRNHKAVQVDLEIWNTYQQRITNTVLSWKKLTVEFEKQHSMENSWCRTLLH